MPDTISAHEAQPHYSHKQILRVVTGIMLCIFLASLDQTVVIPAVPAIAGDLNAFGHLSWIVTAYLLTSTAATPIYGKLSDIYGRRAMLLPALALFILASMACGFAQTLPQLIVARGLQGLGGAGLMAMAQAAVADVVAPRERGRYQGYMASMWGLSSIAGPILGGWVTDQFSWRWVFWINLPVGLVAMVLCNRALKLIAHQRRPAQIDWWGAALLVAGVTAWLLLLSWGGSEYGWGSAPIIGLGVAGAVLLGVLMWHEGRTPDPIVPPRLFRSRTIACGVFVSAFASLGLFGATFLLPLYLQLVLGYSASSSGLLVVPYMASSVVGAMTAGTVARRVGRVRGIILIGAMAALAGFVALALMAGWAPLWLLLPCSFVLGLGTGLTMPTVLMAVQNAAGRADVGAATGTLLFLRSMGGAFGSTVVGALLAARFNAGLAAAGVDHEVDLGALRHGAEGGDALAGLGAISLEGARAALASGFSLAFGACALVTAVALAMAWRMEDLPLRSAAPASEPALH